MKKITSLFFFALLVNVVNSQTTLINPATNGGFESGATFAANGWTVVNDGNNQWYCGGTSTCGGSRAAYIDVNGTTGAANNYNANQARVSHFYRDITFPAGENYITLTFNWKAQGEGCCDYLRAHLVPTTTTPVAGTMLGTGQLGSNLNLQSTCQTATFTFPCTGVAGTTQRLVFTWRNDGSVGTNPAGTIDNISLISSSTAPSCASQLGTGYTAVASLPYASGAGTTCGAVDDLTPSNAVTCGSTLYQDGEDRVWEFTPTTTGQITINLTSSGSYTGLMLYNGCPISTVCTGSPGACIANTTSSTGNKTLTACVTAGVTYYLVLDSWPNPTCNAYTNLTISAPVPPGACAASLGSGVTTVASLPYSSGAGTTCGAGNDLTSSNMVTCGSTSYLGGEDRVWVFTPTTTGAITINLTSSGSYNGLMLYDGCPITTSCSGSPGTCVASAQSSAGNQSLSACVTAGTTYYLVLDVFPSPSCNPYSNLTISAPTGNSCNYVITTPAYNPSSYTAGTLLSFPDDQHSASVPIGFTFCYYGTNYTNCIVSSNSYVSFNTAFAGTYSSWVTVPIPTATPAEVVNTIMFPWQDIDPSIGTNSDIRYLTSGTAPNRKFIVNFSIVPMFSSSCNSLLYTGQLVLNETSNTIETYIQNKPLCASWNSGNAVHGLNGPGGCSFAVVPGRNNTNWTASNDAKLFTPAGCCNTVLSGELISFEGEQISKNLNIIKWSSATETNLDKYIIEKSIDGVDFEYMGEKSASGNSSLQLDYSLEDNSPFERVTFYRMKQVSFSGEINYSSTISINNTNWEGYALLNLFPNPSESLAYSEIFSSGNANFSLEIKDITGRTIQSTNHQLVSGSNIITHDISSFDNGIYLFIYTDSNSSKTETIRLIKN